jgi:hypothetical protein
MFVNVGVHGSEDRVLTHPEHDVDGDGIKDILEVAIADAIASGRGDQYTEVFTQFSTAPTDDDVAIFVRYGGVLTSQVFSIGSKFLGFYGNIPYNQIVDYAAANIRIGYIEGIPDPKEIELCMAYGSMQIGARGDYGARAESMPTNCDYEHVAMLFNAKGYVITEVVDSWIMRVEIRHVVCTKNSTYGLSYAPEYNLVHDYQEGPWWTQVINMRDVAQAIQNYQKSQST